MRTNTLQPTIGALTHCVRNNRERARSALSGLGCYLHALSPIRRTFLTARRLSRTGVPNDAHAASRVALRAAAMGTGARGVVVGLNRRASNTGLRSAASTQTRAHDRPPCASPITINLPIRQSGRESDERKEEGRS